MWCVRSSLVALGLLAVLLLPTGAGTPSHRLNNSCEDGQAPLPLYECAIRPFAWVDLGANAATVPLADNAVSAPIDLGFPFAFYGAPFDTIVVSSNGFVSFDPTSPDGCCAGQPVPDPAAPNLLVAGFWTDLDPAAGGTVRAGVVGTPGSGDARFVVEWADVPRKVDGAEVTFQIVLWEKGSVIDVAVDEASAGGGVHTIGIEGPGGLTGLRAAFGLLAPGDTVYRFIPACVPMDLPNPLHAWTCEQETV